MRKVNQWFIFASREPIINRKKLCPFFCTFVLIVITFTLGCGKKADDKEVKPPRYTNPQISDIELELSKQELFCGGSDNTCPSYLTKIAIFYKDQLKYCTGFLTEADVVVTSSSCLPERLRIKDGPCEKELFFFFAETNRKPLRIGCNKILEVSQLGGKEPFLWRSDVAYIQLKKEDFPRYDRRKTVAANRSGMNNMDKFYIWSVDQIDDYQGIIRKSEDCQAIHNSYFNPIATHQDSPVMMLAGCEFSAGNGGAPILDYRGKVRGVLSKPVDKSEIDEVISMRILEKPLKNLVHASNYSCAPMYPEQDVINESECNKKIDINVYDAGQLEMINESILFKSSIQKIEHKLNEANRYLKMAVELKANEDAYDVIINPKCFKNVSKWIGEFTNNKPFTFNIELPEMKIKKAMNENGRIFALETRRDSIPTNFQFKPSILRNTEQATVFVWAEGPTRTFPGISENCGSLF
jgi:hypothetical protein